MTLRGRYLVTTIALLVALAYAGLEATRERPAPRRPRIPAPAARPIEPLTARGIVARGAELELTPEQTSRLVALDRAWQVEIGERQASAEAAREGFSAFAGAQVARGASLAEIQRQSALYRERSAELRARLLEQAAAAAAILTDGQRRHLAPAPSLHTSGERE